MDIEFITEQQSLETLCFHYILNQTSKSKLLIVNSILMQLATQPRTLHELFQICERIVDDSSTTMVHKEYYRNIAILLREIITKYPSLLPSATFSDLADILTFCCKQAFCAVAGNDLISVLALLLHRTQITPPDQSAVYGIVQSMLMDSKMHIGSYRQITRNHLLTVLYRIVQGKMQQQLNTEYMKKIIRLVEDEKDPRNISLVFQIYLQLLQRGPAAHLQGVRKQIFDGLEMYYPIDFEGDADKHSIRLQDISFLLDQCLTNVMFATELRTLLMVKMGAAPVSKYISTFINTRHHPRNRDSISFWLNLLLRTSEEQYLQEEYPQNCQYTLSNLVSELLNRLVVKNTPIPRQTSAGVIEWLDRFITKQVLRKEDNSKYANLIIVTLKDIMTKCTGEVKYLVASFAVCKFVQYWKEGVGDIVYKLGILVPVLESQFSQLDSEQIGLFIISLAQIFHTSEDPQPKLIVLKLYMVLSRSPVFSKMIAKTNMLQTCLQLINSQSHDVKVTKAFLDFLIQLYATDQRVQQAIVDCPVIQIKAYGLLTLACKIPLFYSTFNELIKQGNPAQQQYLKQLLKNLRMFKSQPSLDIISSIKLEVGEKQGQQLSVIIDQKSTTIVTSRNKLMSFMGRHLKGRMMVYMCRNVWRPYLTDAEVRLLVKNKIEEWLDSEGNQYSARVAAFYNKSLHGLGKLPDEISLDRVKDKPSYWKQSYSMLPTEQGHEYVKQECRGWPTLVHYCWSSSKTMRTDLIQCLPTCILAGEADRILPLVISNCDVHTLSKILATIPEAAVVSEVIPFVRDFLQTCNNNTQVEKVVACNKILLALESRAKDEEQIHATLMKNKGRILVAVEERLLQHRKRRARQSSRTIFSLYNSLK